jgi:hypothetical protein
MASPVRGGLFICLLCDFARCLISLAGKFRQGRVSAGGKQRFKSHERK